MLDIKTQLQDLDKNFAEIKKSIDLTAKKKRFNELEARSTMEGFWDDHEAARNSMQELSDIRKQIEEIEEIDDDLKSLLELADSDLLANDLEIEIKKLEKKLAKLETSSFLSGPYDKKNAIVSIHSGQGGTEAMDWANMLYRMYTRYFEKLGWKYEVFDMTTGEEAGIKSVTMDVRANHAYGYLKKEAGTHRLVRQSPFNADNLRQTSFALVEVLPELSESDASDIEIKDEDLEWQFFRSSGHGGQNVNKVNTAVRLTHIPTGVVVTSRNQRYQEKNRKSALDQLRSKLWLLQQQIEDAKVKKIKGEYQPASWGTQIRSYVLHPYKMVKDLRTKVETSDAEGVLDGDLDAFIEAELRHK